MAAPEKPEKFGGERDEDVDEFLTTMNVYLRSIHIPQGPTNEMEKYKVVLLHRHLMGRARLFWQELGPTKKTTYELATSALRQRFPVPNHEIARLDSRNRAIMEMNNLVQGSLTGDEYVERVQDIYAKLGEEYALSLATRFVDGINDRMVQIQVDGQLRGVYTPFQEVIQAYLGCTATLRRREAAVLARNSQPEPESQGYEHVIRQMGEMFKNILSRPPNSNQRQPPSHPSYQPIVGSVSQGSAPAQNTRPTAYPGQRDIRSKVEVTCFRCGEKGHRAYECSNTPLTREEQDRLRKEYTRDMGPRYPPQVVAAVEISPEIEDTDPSGMVMMSANLVEAFSGDSYEVRQLKERVACLESAMAAEKRGREQTGDTTLSDEPTRGRRRGERSMSPAGSQPMTARIRSPLIEDPANPFVRESITTNLRGRLPISARMDGPDNNHQNVAMSEDDVQPPGGQPFIPNPYFADPAVYSKFVPTATAPRTRKKRGPPKPKRHIRMVQGMPEWDPVEMFKNLPVTGLNVARFFDVAPGARMAVAKALQMQPVNDKRTRVGKSTGRVVEAGVCAVSGVRDKIQGVIHGVLPEPTVRFFNFHTAGEAMLGQSGTGKSKNYLDKILIDGGAVVNLMSEEVARSLGLPLTENSDILIRTATNEIRCVKYCTKFDVRIAGVTATITVHVLDIPQSYSLLLGRRWLYQVRAIGDYATQSYIIYDAEGNPHQLSSSMACGANSPGNPKGPDVLLNPEGGPGLTDQEKEEIRGQERMQVLLTRVASEAHEQILEYEEDYGDDEEEEYEEEVEEGDSSEELPKGQRQ